MLSQGDIIGLLVNFCLGMPAMLYCRLPAWNSMLLSIRYTCCVVLQVACLGFHAAIHQVCLLCCIAGFLLGIQCCYPSGMPAVLNCRFPAWDSMLLSIRYACCVVLQVVCLGFHDAIHQVCLLCCIVGCLLGIPCCYPSGMPKQTFSSKPLVSP